MVDGSDNNQKFRTKRDFVVEALRDAIIRGEIEPGRRLRQEEVAEEMGISPTPVREALRRLEAEGLVTHVPHKGVRVAEFTIEDAQEIYLIRSVLESLAARLGTLNIPAEGVVKLERLQAQMEEMIKKKRLKQLPKVNDEFHMTLYAASNLTRLYQMISRLWVSFPRDTFWIIPERAVQSTEEHQLILEAIREKDAEKAGDLMRHHIESAARSLVGFLHDSRSPSTGPRHT